MCLELSGGSFVLSDDGLTMAAAVLVDMVKGLFERGYGLDGELIIHELRAEAVFRGMLQTGVLAIEGCIGLGIRIDDDGRLSHRGT